MTSQTSGSPGLSGIPQPILLATTGLGAITFVVVGAIGLRTLLGGPAMAGGPRVTPSAAAPTATASASADAVETDTPPDAADLRELRARIEKELRMARHKDFVKDVEELVRLDPDALKDRKIRLGVIETLMIVMTGAESTADRLFDLLEKKSGPAGIDVLYELITTRGGSRAAGRAAELLRDEAVRERGSDALRIAYDLRTAPCPSKGKLFGRAGAEGDKRAHDELIKLKTCRSSPRCCLYSKSAELQAAMDAIEARPR